MAKKKSKQENWLKFEQEVADVLELAGYSVERDVLIAGGQSDIVAKHKTSIIQTRIIIECKHSETNSSVSVDDVENFLSRVQMLRTNDKIDSGFLITNTKFSRYAKKANASSYVQLLTLNQLRRNIFDFVPYLKDIISFNDHISHPLIRPSCSLYRNSEILMFKANRSTEPYEFPEATDLLSYLEKWLRNDKCSQLCILGDYGVGKTTATKWFASIVANNFLQKPEDWHIPILIPLWKYTKAIDVQALITHHIANECGITNFRYTTFIGLLRAGIFLLILDGFDEMARYVDADVRYRTLADIGTLAQNKAKIILTGRPSYFPTEDELGRILSHEEEFKDIYDAARDALDELADYDLINLEPLNESQIVEYLKSTTNDDETTENMLKIIKNTYDLIELASRPVLLEMLVKSIPILVKNKPTTVINAARLYDVYTSQWIDREHGKGEFRKLIRKEDKITFMEELAFQLFVHDKQSINFAEIGNPIKEFFKISEADKLDHFSHDIRTCSFLQRVSDDYKFSHFSFQEFFVAKKIVREAARNKAESWDIRQFPPQIVRFASELLAIYPDTSSSILSWAGKGIDTIIGMNALSVLVFGGFDLSPELTKRVGIEPDIYKSYAAFLIGDNRRATKFYHYIYEVVVHIAKEEAFRRGEIYDHELDDIIQETYLNIIGVLRSKPLFTAKELNNMVLIEVKDQKHYLYHSEESISLEKQEKLFKPDYLKNIPDSKSNSLQKLLDSESLNILLLTINDLPEKYKEAIKLYYIKEYLIGDVAAILRISSKTATVMIKRGLVLLKKQLSMIDTELLQQFEYIIMRTWDHRIKFDLDL